MRLRSVASVGAMAILAVLGCARRRERVGEITRTHDDEDHEITSPDRPRKDDHGLVFEKAHYVLKLPLGWHEDPAPPSTTTPASAAVTSVTQTTYRDSPDGGGGEMIMVYAMDFTATPAVYPTIKTTYGLDLSKDWARRSFEDALHVKLGAASTRGVFIGGHGVLLMFMYMSMTGGPLALPDAMERIEPR